MSPSTYYTATDWEQSSGPIIPRQYPVGNLWPLGLASEIGGGNKQVLVDGIHPPVAIGLRADRGNNQTGVVLTYNALGDLAQVNIAEGFITRQWVANILTYNGGNPATWAAAFNIGAPVYIDDSANLSAGCNLSLSPLNSAGSGNPFFGYLIYAQDEYVDHGVGGAGVAAVWPVAGDVGKTLEVLLTVEHINR